MALRTACVLSFPSRFHLAPEVRQDLLELDHLAMESAIRCDAIGDAANAAAFATQAELLFDRLTSAVAIAKKVLDAARAARAQEQQEKESRL